ncbi:MAG: putative toxin-antitoxin system toxin component, PIN family [Elusimicrobia bacterium]|nr:putative toxin-antitoxin system toxin component, PIN family [Elusimicrobiota bacterium]
MRIVLDTNVFVSAALRPEGHVAPILQLAAEGRLAIFVSSFILAELERTLASPKIGFDPARVRATLASVRENVAVVEPTTMVNAIHAKDSDNRILECALEAKADVLVTGNMRHIRPLGAFQGIAILTPREFLDKYFPAN